MGITQRSLNSPKALMKQLLTAPMLLVCALSSFAAQYYMAPNGSDNNPGTITAPWQSVSASSAKLRPGDTLYARGGTYTGQASVSWRSPSGAASAPITWKAYPGETPVFDGQNTQANFMSIVGTDWLVLDGITIRNYRGCCAAIWIGYSGSGTDYAENNVIRNMTITDIGNVNDQHHGSQTHGIYVSYGNRNLTLNGNTILRITGAGIHCYHDPGLSGGYIFNNVIDGQKIAAWGIVLRDTTNVQVYNNTIINTRPYNSDGGSDIDAAGSTNVTIQNNILSLPIEGAGGIACSNNLFTDDANGNPSSPNCGTNNVIAPNSAGFANASANDYHLTSASPAIDKGIPISSETTDKDGVSRPQGSPYDIGAYQF
jgi:Right handed beta helix region